MKIFSRTDGYKLAYKSWNVAFQFRVHHVPHHNGAIKLGMQMQNDQQMTLQRGANKKIKRIVIPIQ